LKQLNKIKNTVFEDAFSPPQKRADELKVRVVTLEELDQDLRQDL